MKARAKELSDLLTGGADGRVYIDGATAYVLRRFLFKSLGAHLIDDYQVFQKFKNYRNLSVKENVLKFEKSDVREVLGGQRALVLDVVVTTIVDLIADDSVFKNLELRSSNFHLVRQDAWNCLFGTGADHLRMLCEDILGLRFETVQKLGLQMLGILMRRLRNYREAQAKDKEVEVRVQKEIIEIPLSRVEGLKGDHKACSNNRCKGRCKHCKPRKHYVTTTVPRREVAPELQKVPGDQRRPEADGIQLDLFVPSIFQQEGGAHDFIQ